MNKYRLRITLLSDLCVSDGGVYNSALDTEVCYDTYGFPFIPAKRLKGCLRECAIELKDWGKNNAIEKLFGNKGNQRGAARISNAYVENYAERKQRFWKIRIVFCISCSIFYRDIPIFGHRLPLTMIWELFSVKLEAPGIIYGCFQNLRICSVGWNMGNEGFLCIFC